MKTRGANLRGDLGEAILLGLQEEAPTLQDSKEFERVAEEDPESFWGSKATQPEDELKLPKVETDASASLDQRHLDMPSDSSISSLRYALQAEQMVGLPSSGDLLHKGHEGSLLCMVLSKQLAVKIASSSHASLEIFCGILQNVEHQLRHLSEFTNPAVGKFLSL